MQRGMGHRLARARAAGGQAWRTVRSAPSIWQRPCEVCLSVGFSQAGWGGTAVQGQDGTGMSKDQGEE